MIEIEYRIIKIFFIYYNICYHENKKIEEYTKLRHWYEENIQNIKNKLKKIYYLSKKEMENREYNIDKMLLFLKEEDTYTDEELKERDGSTEYNLNNENDMEDIEVDYYALEETNNENNNINNGDYYENIEIIKGNEIFDENANKKENENNKKEENNKRSKNYEYCLIKFDLLLIYYTLYIYHQDSINEGYLSVPQKKTLLRIIILFLKECLIFLKNLVLCPYYLVEYIYKHYKIKKKKISNYFKNYQI